MVRSARRVIVIGGGGVVVAGGRGPGRGAQSLDVAIRVHDRGVVFCG